MFVSKYNPQTEKREDIDVEPPKPNNRSSVVKYRKYMDISDVNRCIYEEVEIEFLELKSILSSTMLHTEEDFFEGSFAKEFSPFNNFVSNWDRLLKEQTPEKNDSAEIRSARKDLVDVMDAISVSEPRKMKAYFKEREQYMSSKTITFAHLWTLFGPGTKIYAKPFFEDWQMFEVKYSCAYRNPPNVELPGEEAPYDRFAAFDVYCSAFDWDGKHFKRYTYAFTIDKFEGRRFVSTLPCFPTEYYVDENEPLPDPERPNDYRLREELLERGRRFTELCNVKEKYALRRYAGPVLEANLQRFPERVSCYLTSRKKKRQEANLFAAESRVRLYSSYPNPHDPKRAHSKFTSNQITFRA